MTWNRREKKDEYPEKESWKKRRESTMNTCTTDSSEFSFYTDDEESDWDIILLLCQEDGCDCSLYEDEGETCIRNEKKKTAGKTTLVQRENPQGRQKAIVMNNCEGQEDPYSEEEDDEEEEAGEDVENIEDGGLSEEQKAAMIRDPCYPAAARRRTLVQRKKAEDLTWARRKREAIIRNLLLSSSEEDDDEEGVVK
jgi:hypothetical protein